MFKRIVVLRTRSPLLGEETATFTGTNNFPYFHLKTVWGFFLFDYGALK